jgi:hypothetical protein
VAGELEVDEGTMEGDVGEADPVATRKGRAICFSR